MTYHRLQGSLGAALWKGLEVVPRSMARSSKGGSHVVAVESMGAHTPSSVKMSTSMLE